MPIELEALLATGRWPRNHAEAIRQNLQPLVSPDRVKRLSADDDRLFLYPPPFHTAQALLAGGEQFWGEAYAAPAEISLWHSIPIADFGPGSDSPLILDYRLDAASPAVLRLRWANLGQQNHWVRVASTFAEFVEHLCL